MLVATRLYAVPRVGSQESPSVNQRVANDPYKCLELPEANGFELWLTGPALSTAVNRGRADIGAAGAERRPPL